MEDQTYFGSVKRCLVHLWVRYLVHNQYKFGATDEKILQGECLASVSSSQRCCRAVTENAINL